MAVESKRGCGYRKVGGLYLVDDGAGQPCCKLPLELSICPCCGNGIKQTRGWTWIDAAKMFAGGERCQADILSRVACPAANPAVMGRVGLLWIGEKFYPRPVDFLNEAAAQGISRRLSAVPREFKAGETWVLFAHPKAIQKPRTVANEGDGWVIKRADGETEEDLCWHDSDPEAQRLAEEKAAALDLSDPIYVPGVIRIARPKGFEKIVTESQAAAVLADRASWEANDDPDRDEDDKSALLKQFEADAKRGIKWVAVPDNDPDHQGTVYDKAGKEEAEA